MSSLPLPDEVIVTILLGVPAFDLVRLKGVCRGWRSLISSADFVAAHLRRAKSDPSSHHILVCNSVFDRRLPEAAAGPLSSFICLSSSDLLIVGSANGLICLAGKGDSPPSLDDIWIWNPVTGLSQKLPYSSRVFDDRSPHNVNFVFWCDDDDGVYKVAKIVSDLDGESMLELWVSTSPDSWSVISTFQLDLELPSLCCDVLMEGPAAYWIVVCCDYEGSDGESDDESDDERDDESDSESDDESRDEVVVVSLDLKTLALTKFVPLTKGQLQLRKGYLSIVRDENPEVVLLFGGSLNGDFALVAYNFSAGDDDYYDVWTHDTGAAVWIKKFTIHFKSFTYEKCLGILNDKILLERYEDAEVVSYDPLTGMLEVLETDSRHYAITLESAFGFVGSLVSINGFGVEPNDLLRKNLAISWPLSL